MDGRSVAPTDSASNTPAPQNSQSVDKLRRGSKVAAVKQFFDIPVVRQENIKIPCNVCQQKLTLSKSSTYNREVHCCRFHKDKWDHVLAGGNLSDCGTLLLQPVIATGFEKMYSEERFREELWK